MTANTSPSSSIEKLTALDPDLPLLASQAAIEIDLLIRKRETALSAAARLATLLGNSLQTAPPAGSQYCFLDPPTEELMSRTFTASHSGTPIRTVKDLVDEALSMVATLKNPEVERDQEALKRTRAFCAALAECAASYLQSVYSQRPAHPYRR